MSRAGRTHTKAEVQGAQDELSPQFYFIRLTNDDFVNAFRGNARRPMDSTRFFDNDMLKDLRVFKETEPTLQQY